MPEPVKTCIFCGLDCSAVAHLRDKQGRYACAACVEAERRRRAGEGEGRAAAAAAREPAPAHAQAEPDAGGYELADNLAGGAAPIAVAPPPPGQAGGENICPVCIVRMPPDVGRCVQCGYDPDVGIQSSRKVRKKATKEGAFRPLCHQCGYDMTGVPGTRCPECGTVCDLSRRRYDREESRRVALWSYLKPAIMLAVGIGGILLLLALTDDVSMIGFYLTKWAVFVPIGVVAFFMCCIMWVGFDAPFHRVALELAAIYAIVDLVSLAVYCVVPFYLVNGLIVYFVYIALLVSILDLEYADAVGVGLVTLLLRIAVLVTMWKIFGLA